MILPSNMEKAEGKWEVAGMGECKYCTVLNDPRCNNCSLGTLFQLAFWKGGATVLHDSGW